MSASNATAQARGQARACALALAALCLAPLSACAADADADADAGADAEPELEIAASTRNHLIWKRYHALEQDLSRALELAPDELCVELGSYNCINEVHLVGLGGHDPFGQGLYEPIAAPLVTTSLAVDRVVGAACSARVERDHSEGVVFSALELDGPAPAATSEAFTETVDALYRRFLIRDPIDAEYEVLAELLVDEDGAPVAADRFAAEACVAVATTTEFLFF